MWETGDCALSDIPSLPDNSELESGLSSISDAADVGVLDTEDVMTTKAIVAKPLNNKFFSIGVLECSILCTWLITK